MIEVARVLRLDLLIKLSLAVFLGGIIGFERGSWASRPACEPTSSSASARRC